MLNPLAVQLCNFLSTNVLSPEWPGNHSNGVPRTNDEVRSMQKHGWDEGQFDIIDWESFGPVYRNLDDPDRLQLFNIVHGTLKVMQQQNIYKYSPTDTCTRCGNEEDTITHMLKCQPQNTDKWKEFFRAVSRRTILDHRGAHSLYTSKNILPPIPITKFPDIITASPKLSVLINICLDGNIACKAN